MRARFEMANKGFSATLQPQRRCVVPNYGITDKGTAWVIVEHGKTYDALEALAQSEALGVVLAEYPRCPFVVDWPKLLPNTVYRTLLDGCH
jgi:hypothetical protein